jgi:hypothetical protein
VLAYKRKDDLTSWYLRVRAYGSRHRVNLGTELDGWTQARARIELQNVLAKIQAGLWEPPAPQATTLDDPTFHQFASSWLARRRPSYKQRTYEHYRYFLTDHLLPAFASLRLSQLDYAAIDRYVEAKQLEAEEIRQAARRGVPLTNANGRRKRPLANSTINATVELLARVLDEAVRRKLVVGNAARAKGLRLKEQRSRGNVLEVDELEDLLAGAAEIDQKVTPKVLERGAAARTLRGQGVAWKDIGWRLGVAEATAIYYAQQHPGGRISRAGRSSRASPVPGCATRSSAGSTSATSTSRTAPSTSRTPRPRPVCARSTSARCCATSCGPGARRSILQRLRARSSRPGLAVDATRTTSTRA